jgi:heme exporter protein D
MLERIWNAIKIFFINHVQHGWLENHLFYLFLVGVAISFILIIVLIIKTNRDIKKMDRNKRKREKRILKYLSDKKNKTY